MKKIISMCLIIAMLLSCLPIGTYAVSDGSSSATIRVDSTTAFPGSTVTINVNIENNPGIIGATLKVEYGPYLTLTEAKNNGVLSTLTMQQSIFSDYANFLWFGATIADDNIQDGVVLELTFEVDADAPLGYQNIEVSYTDGDIDDKNLNSVTLEIENGSVAIIDYLPGDVSGDFKVTPWDLTLLSQYIVDECEYREDGYKVTLNDLAGDVNDSGTLNPRDLILISQYIVDECEYREDSYAVTLLPSSVRTSHTLEAIAAVDATCTENGNIAYWHCTDCDLYFSDANGTTEIDLSDTVVEATGHIAVIDEAVVPTYTTTGLTQGSHCSVCGQVLVAQEEIPVLAKDEYAISYYLYDGDSYLAEIGVTNPNPDVYTSEDGLALEEPTAVGYTFSGWSYGDNADPKKNFVIEAGETGAKKVYAHWTKDTYTVTFKSDMVPQATIENCTSDKAVYLSSLKLDKYTFIGWSDKEGNILTEIPKGNTEDVVLYANWSSNRNQAIPVSTLADPIISEMPDEGIILFTYEIGEIKNVPLYTTLQLNCVNGLISTTEITYVDEISEENAEAVAETIANATTNSASWTLSSDWSQTTEVSESYLNQTGMTREEAESVAVNETNSYNLISSFGDSSSYVDTTSGSYTLSLNEAHSTTDTTETGQDFELSVDAQYSPETEVSFGLFDIFDVSQTYSYEIGGGIDYSNYKHTTTSGTDSYSGSLSLSGADSQTSTDTKTWNTETGYSSSQSISSEQTVSNTISSLISEEYGYGEAYSEGGSNSEAQELASSNSKSNEYSSTLTYYTSKITTTTTSFTSTGETTGDYRMVKAGTVHVFSTVGYDVANKEYFVYTYNVLDDTTTEYLDYSYDGTFNDYETSIIPFEVPAFVNDYVNGRIASTNGLQINTSTGIITGYYPTGSESAEIINIPSYVSVENYDGTYSSVKVTGIAPGLFENNTDIVGVTLGEYITEVPASAFAGCTSLEYIICSAVTSFGDNAFAGCTSLAEFTIPSDIISVGKDAFLGVDSISAVASSATVAQEIAASGANNVVLDISEIPDSDSSNMSLEVGAISSFELWGKDKTYTNLSMSSAAETTVLTGVYVVDGTGVTFDLSSSNVTLNRVTVSSSGYAMLLSAENTSIILNGIVQMSSLSGNTVICKNIQLQTLTISYFSQMAVLVM